MSMAVLGISFSSDCGSAAEIPGSRGSDDRFFCSCTWAALRRESMMVVPQGRREQTETTSPPGRLVFEAWPSHVLLQNFPRENLQNERPTPATAVCQGPRSPKSAESSARGKSRKGGGPTSPRSTGLAAPPSGVSRASSNLRYNWLTCKYFSMKTVDVGCYPASLRRVCETGPTFFGRSGRKIFFGFEHGKNPRELVSA